MMEDKQEDDEDDLIKELTPALHQERSRDFAASVQAILFGRYLPRANSVLHTRCGSHRVFAPNTDTVEEERPGVAYNPAIHCDTPRCGKHEQTEKHDCGILNQTPSTAEPRLAVRDASSKALSTYVITSHLVHQRGFARQ